MNKKICMNNIYEISSFFSFVLLSFFIFFFMYTYERKGDRGRKEASTYPQREKRQLGKIDVCTLSAKCHPINEIGRQEYAENSELIMGKSWANMELMD